MESKVTMNQMITMMKKHSVSAAFLLLLIFTQIHILVPNSITLSGMTRIYITNILIFFYGAYFILYRLFYRKEFLKLGKRSQFVFWAAVTFSFYVAGSYVYRAVVQGNTSVSLAMTQTILLASILFLIIDLEDIRYEEIMRGISIFMFMINDS